MSVIWITGARGFIGQHLSLHLSSLGHKVCGIGHGSFTDSQLESSGLVYWITSNITSTSLSALAEQSGYPDFIYHLAGGSSVGASFYQPLDDYHRTVSSGVVLFEWIRTNTLGTKVILISSAAVHGSSHTTPISAYDFCDPYSPYGFHKYMLEQLARSYANSFNLSFVIVRLFSVYGPFLRKQLIWDLCCKIQASSSGRIVLGGTGMEYRDWTHISDVIRLLENVASLASPSIPIFNAGTGLAHSVSDIATLVVKAWHLDIDIDFTGHTRPGDPAYLVSTPCTINSVVFPFHCSLNHGLTDYVFWFKSTCL